MIDTLLKMELPGKMLINDNSHVKWLLSAGRDRKLVLWKLIDGKLMRRVDHFNEKTMYSTIAL